MNKRANLYLNIYEFISFLLAVTCIGLSLTLKEISGIPYILKSTSLFTGTIFLVFFVLIEIILFLLMKFKMKVIYILYLMIDVLLSIYINNIFPFYGIYVFFFFCILKNCLRIKLVNKIYIPKLFNNYCKMFNIKIADFKKKKEVKEEIPEKPIEIKVVEEIPKKKTSKKTKSNSKVKSTAKLRTKES